MVSTSMKTEKRSSLRCAYDDRRDPKHAMRSFATYVSKIDWKKSESLNELFAPFADLGR